MSLTQRSEQGAANYTFKSISIGKLKVPFLELCSGENYIFIDSKYCTFQNYVTLQRQKF